MFRCSKMMSWSITGPWLVSISPAWGNSVNIINGLWKLQKVNINNEFVKLQNLMINLQNLDIAWKNEHQNEVNFE